MVAVTELLSLIPAAYLEQLAVEVKVDAPNQVRLPGPVVFTCLLATMANHAVVTQRLLQETFMECLGRSTDHSSFGRRLARISPAYFEAIFRHLHRQVERTMTSGDAQALRVRRVDATTVTLSSKLLSFGLRQAGGRRDGTGAYDRHHVKAVLQLSQDGLPDLLHLCQEPKETSDNVALGDPMLSETSPGDLWIFDRGCFDRHRLLRLHQQQAYWLTPHSTQRLRSLRTLWEAPRAAAASPEGQPLAPPAGKGAPLSPPEGSCREPPCRLLRVEAAVFEGAHDRQSPARMRQWATMPLVVVYAERYDVREKQWKPFVLMTNLPVSAGGMDAGPYTFEEVLELYRQRWGIEVFFKFIKQHLGYEHLTSRNENGIRVMIWMALITAVLLIWYKHRTGIDRGWRSVKFWFAEETREWTRQLLAQHLVPIPKLE